MLIWSSTSWWISKKSIRNFLGWAMQKGVVMPVWLRLARGWGKKVIQVRSWALWRGRTLLRWMVVICC